MRSSEKSVLYSLSTYLGSPKHRPDKWNIVWPSQETIQQASGVKSISQISRIVTKLEKEGYLTISKCDTKKGFLKSNIYTLNVTLFYELADSLLDKKVNGDLPIEQLPVANKANKDTNNKIQSLKEDIPIEEISEASTIASHDTPITDHSKVTVEEIFAKYYKKKPTAKTMVGFWWALIDEFHPHLYKSDKKLTTHQYKALLSLFEAWSDLAFFVIGLAVSEWDQAKTKTYQEGAKKTEIPKLGPTIIFISNYADSFHQYWTEQHMEHKGNGDYTFKPEVASAFNEHFCKYVH